MTQSLKSGYEARKIKQLKEHLKVVDRQLLEEHNHARLIMEVMSQKDLDKVSAIIQKLDVIKNASASDLPVLTSAIEQAQAEMNKYTAGGPISKAWSKLVKKVGIDNPVVKVTTFANALEQGFKQIPQILKNNGIDVKQLGAAGNDVKLADAIVQQLNKNTNEDDNQVDLSDDPQAAKKLKVVIDQIKRALAPAGVFGAFKKIPYIDGGALAQALANCNIGVLQKISTAVKSGPQTSEVASDLKANVTDGGVDQTKQTSQSEPGKPSAQTTPGEPTKSAVAPAASTPTGEKPVQGPGEKPGGGSDTKRTSKKVDDGTVKEMAKFVSKKTGVDPETAYKVLSALNASEKLREAFRR